MSRAYRISVTEAIRRHIKVHDGVQVQLDLLPILCPERMGELLWSELAGLGFERDGATARRTGDDGVEVAVDLSQGTVTARLHAEADVALCQGGSATPYHPSQAGRAEEDLRARLKTKLEHDAADRSEHLRQEVTDRLERGLRDLHQSLDSAVNRATVAALKEKAASLGEIEELSEDSVTGTLTIRVRL